MPKIENSIENPKKLQELLKENQNIIFVKFTATWCGPCKRIKPIVDEFISKLPEDCNFHDIDIDETLELYTFFKNKRIVNGIPSILYWKKGNVDMPNGVVVGGNPPDVLAFLNKAME